MVQQTESHPHTDVGFLLVDEDFIDEATTARRTFLAQQMRGLPDRALTRLRHLQFHIGCQNRCGFCSQGAGKDLFILVPEATRDLVAALRAEAHRRGIQVAQDSGRKRVIYNYLDNDPFQAPNLADQVDLVYDNLGMRTRMATVGFPGRNPAMRAAHERLSRALHKVAGLRFSFSDYTYAMTEGAQRKGDADRASYEADLADNLRIYRTPLLSTPGRKEFNVEIRYRPRVVSCEVDLPPGPNFVLRAGPYLLVSKDSATCLQTARLQDPNDHALHFDEPGIPAWLMHAPKAKLDVEWESLLAERLSVTRDEDRPHWQLGELFQFENEDGVYFGFNPKRDRGGIRAKYFYPKIGKRPGSGVIDGERYGLNAIIAEARSDARDPDRVLIALKQQADALRPIDPGAADYIESSVIDLLASLIRVLRRAGLAADLIFNKSVICDTGSICNLGRAFREFKGIASRPNLPLTPHHERTYGVSGELAQEGEAWRIAIHPGGGFDFNAAQRGLRNPARRNPAIVFEMLQMGETARPAGQSKARYYIDLPPGSIKHVSLQDQAVAYWIPGQKVGSQATDGGLS